MNLIVYVGIWAALVLAVLGLAIYRNLLGIHESTLRISGGDASGSTDQMKANGKIEAVERWGEWLTVLVVAYGLVLAAVYFYHISEYHTRMMP